MNGLLTPGYLSVDREPSFQFFGGDQEAFRGFTCAFLRQHGWHGLQPSVPGGRIVDPARRGGQRTADYRKDRQQGDSARPAIPSLHPPATGSRKPRGGIRRGCIVGSWPGECPIRSCLGKSRSTRTPQPGQCGCRSQAAPVRYDGVSCDYYECERTIGNRCQDAGGRYERAERDDRRPQAGVEVLKSNSFRERIPFRMRRE